MEDTLVSGCALITAASVLVVLVLGFVGAPLWLWTIAVAGGLAACAGFECWQLWAAFGAVAVVLNVPPIRRLLLTSWIFRIMKGVMPAISETERVALTAGDVWVEGDLFSGKPDLKRLISEPYPELTPEEKAFLDGPCEQVCQMTSDWDVFVQRDLPPEVWEFIKKERFLGMIIPKEYGGLGFSALAHSAVIKKLGSRSVPLCISVMVPNSLGPAELLIHYGTQAQKDHYLPRLARGEDLPCFALTEPNAGSDAGSITSSGVVFKGADGKLYLRLNWNKRWITLAAISTVLGLAFRLKDPENLLGKNTKDGELGITCALIPTKSPGVTANRRHDPLGVPFYNCPTQGKDVVVPIDAIIGGVENAGQGWKMLMESLAAGRGVSLPAQATGGAKFLARVTSAHAIVRKQFGISIGKFEGVMEPLARIGGYTYLLEAARKYTLGAIDQGRKPPVITAIAKYNFTEIGRKLVNDAMDILGGAAISRGPRNLLANGYAATPICVTVEGANILTRTLIIFGQGALRAHPYAFKEVDAVEKNDLAAFDAVFWRHMGHVIRNGFRSVLLYLTRGRLVCAPVCGPMKSYWKRLAWMSAVFALMADLAMAGLGGSLKFKEKLTGRFADVLSWMYLATATLRRFEADGRRAEDLPYARWALEQCFWHIHQAFDGIYANFSIPGMGWLFKGPVRFLHHLNPFGYPTSDRQDVRVAGLLMTNGPERDRLYGEIFVPTREGEALTRLEQAFALTLASEEISHRVRKAVREKRLTKKPPAQLYADAVAAGVITRAEFETIDHAEKARWDAIQVDDFGLDEYLTQKP